MKDAQNWKDNVIDNDKLNRTFHKSGYEINNEINLGHLDNNEQMDKPPRIAMNKVGKRP